MASLTIIDLARLYLEKIPGAVSGSGGHNQTFTAACALVKGFDLSIDEARPLLHEFNARCEPPWTHAELEHKLRQADGVSDDGRTRGWLRPENQDRNDGPREPALPSRAPSNVLPEPGEAKPQFDAEKLKRFAARWRGFVDTVWLSDRSPELPFGANGGLSADGFLRAVFREGEKVVIFTNQRSQGQALWPAQPAPLAGDEGVWYLAQPVDGKEHPNPRSRGNNGEPKMSRRSEESVTDWRHLVLESDEADSRDWLAALVQLPLRVAAIYTSGKRSIHALVRIDAPSMKEWNNIVRQIRPMLVTLGADPRAMSAVRLTRLPGCLRGPMNGRQKLQKLLYLNPEPAAQPICTLPKLRDSVAHWINMARIATTLSLETVRASTEDWAEIERCRAGLKWFESNTVAREELKKLEGWTR